MHIFISADVIYFYLLLDKVIKSNSISDINTLRKFFNLTSLQDIFIYSALTNILGPKIDIFELKKYILNINNKNNITIKYLTKLHKLTKLYLKEKINLSNKNYINKLSLVIKKLEKYSQSELVLYLSEAAKYLLDNYSEKTQNIALSCLFILLEEYFDLFIDAKEIKFNEEYIYEKFKIYFDIFHYKPQTILFINNNNNIKIMQDFFHFEKYSKIFNLLEYTMKIKPKEKYFLIEADKKLCSKTKTELLCHEIGHLLNLKVYNFQNIIFNLLYKQNPNVEPTILNSWLNEIIADIIGYNLCNPKFYINSFSQIDNNIDNVKYPPLDFRTSILLNKDFNSDLFKNEAEREVGMLIQNNIKLIKPMLQIVK